MVAIPLLPLSRRPRPSRAYDLGMNFFETAHLYWDGHSEEVYGAVLPQFRKEVFITTKSMQLQGSRLSALCLEPAEDWKRNIQAQAGSFRSVASSIRVMVTGSAVTTAKRV